MKPLSDPPPTTVIKVARYSFHSLRARAVALFLGRRDACKAFVDLANSGFCKFIENFLVPVSPISFGEFFFKFSNTVKPTFSLMMNVSNLLIRSCNLF